MERKRLNEQFPDWITGNAIFSALQSFNVPWQSENIAEQLDYEYFGNHSGEKFISPLVRKLNDRQDISDADRIALLANTIYNMYKVNWQKQYATLSFEYNAVGNYDVTETMTDDETVDEYGHTGTRTDNLSHTKTGTETEAPNLTDKRTDDLSHKKTGTETQAPNTTETRTDNLTHAKTGTETQTPNTTETQTPNLTTNSDVSGFNSSLAVNSNVQSTTGTSTTTRTGNDTLTHNTQDSDTGTQTVARTGQDVLTHNTTDTETGTQTVARTGQDTLTYNTTDADTGTQAYTEGGQDTHTRNYTLTRSGTLGLVPIQTLVTDERKLWLWNFFNDIVFPDVDKVLTIQIY